MKTQFLIPVLMIAVFGGFVTSCSTEKTKQVEAPQQTAAVTEEELRSANAEQNSANTHEDVPPKKKKGSKKKNKNKKSGSRSP